MNLTKINIKNFRCFEDLSIDFHPQMNVFVGVNGSGKTALLDAIGVGLKACLEVFGRGIFRAFLDDEDTRILSVETGNVVDRCIQLPTSLEFFGNINNQPTEWTLYRGESEYGTTGSNIANLIMDMESNTLLSHDSVQLPIARYIPIKNKYSPDVSMISTRLQGYVGCLHFNSTQNAMIEWFKQMTFQGLQEEKEIQELTAVTNAMKKCIEGIMKDVTDIRVRYGVKYKELEILYTDKNGKKQRQPFRELSDGYRKTLSLVADIAYRMAVLNPQLLDKVIEETSGIVLIDEIDLHLHPSWQQRILGDLMAIFPKVQFIVTTHAPSVISSVYEENLFLLKDGKCLGTGFEVFGRDVNTVLQTVMGVSERPDEVQAKFDKFYDAMDNEEFDTAEKILNDLRDMLGNGDPEITSASVSLSLERM